MPARGEQVPGHRKARRSRAATPSPPWNERLDVLLKRIASSTIVRFNARMRCRSQADRDISRAISEGFLTVGRQRRFTTVKILCLTERGLSRLPVPPANESRTPYAKRAAGLADLRAANPARFPSAEPAVEQ